MITSVILPKWLDELIFDNMGAKYCRSNTDMTVIDWDKNDVLNYLGTYFPRSYAESYCIFSEFFKSRPKQFADKEEISIFDFGCGTGGEIIGLLTILSQSYPKLKKVRIVALDGNIHALKLYDKVSQEYQKHVRLQLDNHSAHVCIDDFYDLGILNNVIKRQFDIIISFKAICEFVTKQQFEQENAYKHIVRNFIPKLKSEGLMVLDDVTTYNNVSQEWLPQMMDKGLMAADCSIAFRNEGYNQSFFISHSHRGNDESKVAWRIITKKR